MKTKTITCEDCRGSGIRENARCPLCNGKGERQVVYQREDIHAQLNMAMAELLASREAKR